MRTFLIAAVLLCAGVCSGEVLRISRVVEEGAENAERMTLKIKKEEEHLWISKERVITDAEVKHAQVDVTMVGTIAVRLTEAGAEKLTKATSQMRHGHDRMAIIMEGELISAPVVQSVLGRSFLVSGMQEFGEEKLDALAREMCGLPPRVPVDPIDLPPVPELERVPYTEEEYQEIKAEREKMGLFHLEKSVSRRKLDKVLREGMPENEVIAIFGKPLLRGDGGSYLMYEVAPEKRPLNKKGKLIPNGFTVQFEDGKVESWGMTYTRAPREMRVIGREEYTLDIELPEMDLSAGDLDLIALFQGVKIADPTREINRADLGLLLTVVGMLTGPSGEALQDRKVKVTCDMMKILGHHIPEVAELRKEAKGGVIRVRELSKAMHPYVWDFKLPPGFAPKDADGEAGAM